MKEKDVYVDFKKHMVIIFAEKEDGSYGSMQTGSYLAKKYLDDFWEKMEHFHNIAFTQLKNNEISPIAYYIITKEMGVADIAARVGISLSLVKKHMKQEHFENMKLSTAKRYAEIFGIPVANLFQIISPKENAVSIQQVDTSNPFVVTIECKKGEQ